MATGECTGETERVWGREDGRHGLCTKTTLLIVNHVSLLYSCIKVAVCRSQCGFDWYTTHIYIYVHEA